MNFDKTLMQNNGHGDYVELELSSLPPSPGLWLAYLADPSDR